ncbi:glycosyltransferase [Candidatus Gottesmanbacteria bacterium]|nr:glycosyltransferase [Candidatus Gottesmanbacteria bacterium]
MKKINNKKLVSIGIPAYNGEPYIREALQSLVTQSYKHIEIIVSDDASTDATLSICKEFARKDKRIKILQSDKNRGAILNFRKVFNYTHGEYFMWGSNHDIWHKNFVKILVLILEENRDVVLAYPRTKAINEKGKVLSYRFSDFDTARVPKMKRVKLVCQKMVNVGNMAYGLMRRDILRRTSIYPYCLMPDRLVLMELSVWGQFKQVKKYLWKRRFFQLKRTADDEIHHQYLSLFEDGKIPFWARFPVLTHMIGLIVFISLFPRRHIYSNFFIGFYMAFWYFVRKKGYMNRLILFLKRFFP